MKWRSLVALAAAAAACRVGDLVETPISGARLEFSVQPSRTETGKPITPPVQITVRDDAGRPDTAYHDSVALDLGQNPGGAALIGTWRAQVQSGKATFADLRVDKPGDGYMLRATAPGHPAVMSSAFGINAPPVPDTVPDPPAPNRLAFSVQPTTTRAGVIITPAIQIAVRDSAGGVVTSYAGTVTIAIATNPADGTLTGATAAAASNGVAVFGNLAIDRAGSGYSLRATAAGLTASTSATFNITAPPPEPLPARHLVFTVQPSNTQAGQSIAPAVQVAARDSTGNAVTSYAGTITVAIGANPASGTLTGTLSAAASGGVATFASLRIDRAGTGYTLTAAASGLTGAISAAFNITAPPPQATQLAFISQPSSTEAGSPISPAIHVAARDAAGNVVTSYAGTITLAIGNNPGGGTLSGMTSSVATNGIATFGGLRIDRAGNGYTLTAASSGLNGTTSAAFNITAPPPTQQPTSLRFIVQPSNTGVNQPISPPVQVEVLDQQGARITNYTGAVTIDLAPNLLNATVFGTVTVNAVGGVATFSNLRVNLVGVDFRLRAAFAGQTPIATSSAFTVLL